MADNPETPEPFSLKRWSQRKRAAAQTQPRATIACRAPAAEMRRGGNGDRGCRACCGSRAIAAPLPPVDSLTFDSDFSAFMQPKIAEETKRAALRKLFSDPSFNVMDGLDIYVGDYTQSDPMPSGMLDKLVCRLRDARSRRTRARREVDAAARRSPGAADVPRLEAGHTRIAATRNLRPNPRSDTEAVPTPPRRVTDIGKAHELRRAGNSFFVRATARCRSTATRLARALELPRQPGRAHDACASANSARLSRARKAMSWPRARRSSSCCPTPRRKAARRRRSGS